MLSNISETLVSFIAQNRPHGVKTVSRNLSCARRKKQALHSGRNRIKRNAGKSEPQRELDELRSKDDKMREKIEVAEKRIIMRS